MTGKLRPKMPNVALELENTPINSEIPYNQTSKRQTTELQAGAPNSKQRYSGKKTHSAVFAKFVHLFQYLFTINVPVKL